MAKQSAQAIVVSIMNNATPTPAYEVIAGLRARSIGMNSEAVDITNANSTGRFREILDTSGVISATFSGSGVLDTGTPASELIEIKLAGSVRDFKFTVPGLGDFECPAKLTQFEVSGDYNDAVMVSMTFESAGEITFTAE